MLKFDRKTAARLDKAYPGKDFVRRRAANADALDAKAGDTILDIGCGPGHLTLELAPVVGHAGRVIGIDPSEEMRGKAQARCRDRANISIIDGDALHLPVDDGSADGAVSIQVFEYLDDIPGALNEAYRALRAGGRLVVGDIHWDSLVWFSEEPARLRQVVDAYDSHLREREVAALLPGLMTAAGYEVEAITPVTFVDTVCRDSGLADLMLTITEAYVLQNELVDEETVRAFIDEQHRLIADGRFFFSLTHFVIAARKKA